MLLSWGKERSWFMASWFMVHGIMSSSHDCGVMILGYEACLSYLFGWYVCALPFRISHIFITNRTSVQWGKGVRL